MNKKNFPSYEEAQKIVMDNNIKSASEYKSSCKKLGLPSNPNVIYKDKDWIDWPTFWGEKKKEFPSYEEAQKIVMENNIKSASEYKSSYDELGLPSAPQRNYKDKGWINWPTFLGKDGFPSYEEAQKIVIENNIKSVSEYKSSYDELGLPSNPYEYYKDKGWINWPTFWGEKKKEYPSYEEAKKIVMENNIKSASEYKSYYKKLGLPSSPDDYYKDKGWIDWPTFWGEKKKEYPSYEEAQKIVIENNIKSVSEYKSSYGELGLPSNPNVIYKDKGWISWPVFWGKSKKTTPAERKTNLLINLSIYPVLLDDDAPLQVIYMLASLSDQALAREIEELLAKSSGEERQSWINEQLKDLKGGTPTLSKTASKGTVAVADDDVEADDDELSAMESILEVFEDSLETISADVEEKIKQILDNYSHGAINRELIDEYDG